MLSFYFDKLSERVDICFTYFSRQLHGAIHVKSRSNIMRSQNDIVDIGQFHCFLKVLG